MRKSKADYEKKNQDNVPSSLRDSFKETLTLRTILNHDFNG